MSPKSLVFLLIVGLCATQMVSGAHRDKRGFGNIMKIAKDKLEGLIKNVQDAAGANVGVVFQSMEKLESRALEVGTKGLKSAGIELDLKAVASLLKDNAKVCLNNNEIKTEATAIIKNVGSCVSKDIAALKKLMKSMKELWNTAKRVPKAVSDVANQCSANIDTSIPQEALDAAIEKMDEIPDEPQINDVVSTEHRITRRAAWNLSRIVRCVKAVFNLAKSDLAKLPGKMISTAKDAFSLIKSAQSGIHVCISKKLTESTEDIKKLAIKAGTCVKDNVSEDEDLNKMVEKTPALKAVKQLADLGMKFAKGMNLFPSAPAAPAAAAAPASLIAGLPAPSSSVTHVSHDSKVNES